MDAHTSTPQRQWLRIGLLASIAGHLLVVSLLVFLWDRPAPKRPDPFGDSLVVELPKPDDPPRPLRSGLPREPEPPPQRAAAPPKPPAPPRAVRPTPPPRPAPEPPRVASAPPPAPAAPQPPAPSPQASEPAPAPAPPAPVAKPAEPAPAAEPSPPRPSAPPEPPRVAAVPGDAQDGSRGAPARPVPDLRSALRRGDGPARFGSRGGIEGDPIPLNSADPDFREYLSRITRMIEDRWSFPCMKTADPRDCGYRQAELYIEFGILKNGKLQFIELRRTSGLPPYDDAAMTAVKLASPFPDVPPALMARAKAGSTGVPIMAHFIYTYEVSVRTLLR